MADLLSRHNDVLAPVIAFDTKIHAERADGIWITDPDGNRWADFACGTAVTNLGHRHPAVVEGDVERLTELFDNLLDNAVRYSRPQGRVTVRVQTGPRPSVCVNDDGPSIPAHERERVFERFHRLLGTARDGSGLGLAIAREIARIHGAEIVLADDEDGIGNSFRVTFPPPRAPLAAASAESM